MAILCVCVCVCVCVLYRCQQPSFFSLLLVGSRLELVLASGTLSELVTHTYSLSLSLSLSFSLSLSLTAFI